jgi:hypothetical protein
MPILYETYQENPGAYLYEESFQEGMGWPRTIVLGLGAAAGVIGTAAILHVAKRGRPEAEPRGWPRTLILSAGALGGTLLAAELIHLVRAPETLSLEVEEM